MRDEARYREYHLFYRAVLDDSAVEARHDARGCGQLFREQHGGAERREGVEALRARPLPVFVLQRARRHVVHYRVAEDVVVDLFFWDVFAALAYDDGELSLVVYRAGPFRDADEVVRAGYRRGGFEEYQRLLRYVVVELFYVADVVAADAPDFLGREGRQEFYALDGIAEPYLRRDAGEGVALDYIDRRAAYLSAVGAPVAARASCLC